jgi:TrmH family RNA methyltransferase
MLSKNKIKFIRSLHTNKGREAENCFVAEGERILKELIDSNGKIIEIIALPGWIDAHRSIQASFPIIEANQSEINAVSNLNSPQQVLCIVEINAKKLNINNITNQLVIALDKVQDPGNMGTIIRLANWFGIESILCSNDCVDIYNPKVIQATMGAIAKTTVYYCNLEQSLQEYASITNNTIYGTFLEGENIYLKQLSQVGIIVLGNEGNGISETITKQVNSRITIPSFNNMGVVESLNVSIAAAIICSEFRRKT